MCTLFSEMKLSTNLDLIWNVICFFVLPFLCMMCYLQLHNTRLSSIFMCFSFFFFVWQIWKTNLQKFEFFIQKQAMYK